MKTFSYIVVTMFVGIFGILIGRLTPAWPEFMAMSEHWRSQGKSTEDLLKEFDSITNHIEYGDQLAALISIAALKQIEENKIDSARVTLAKCAAHFHSKYRSSMDNRTQKIIRLIDRTEATSTALKIALSEAEQDGGGQPATRYESTSSD